MGLLGSIGRGFGLAGQGLLGLVDRGANNSLVGTPSQLYDPAAPTTPKQRSGMRSQFLMNLGQGISTGAPAAGAMQFRDQFTQQRMMQRQMGMQEQVQQSIGSILGNQSLPPAQKYRAVADVFSRIGDSKSAERYTNVADQVERLAFDREKEAKPNYGTPHAMNVATGNPDGSSALGMVVVDSKTGKILNVGGVANKNVGAPVAMNLNGKNVMVSRSEYGGDVNVIPGAAPVQENAGAPFLGKDASGNEVTFLPQKQGPPVAAPGVMLAKKPTTAEANDRATTLLGKINIPAGVDINGAQLSSLIANSDLTPEDKQFLTGHTMLHPTTAAQKTLADVRAAGFKTRAVPVIDTETGTMRYATQEEVAKDPTRFAPAAQGAAQTLKASNFGDIQRTSDVVKESIRALPGELTTTARGLMSKVLFSSEEPDSIIHNEVNSRILDQLSKPEQNLIIAIAQMKENANRLAPTGAQSESVRRSIQATIPGARGTRDFMLRQVDAFDRTVGELRKGVVDLGKGKKKDGTAELPKSNNFSELHDLIMGLPNAR